MHSSYIGTDHVQVSGARHAVGQGREHSFVLLGPATTTSWLHHQADHVHLITELFFDVFWELLSRIEGDTDIYRTENLCHSDHHVDGHSHLLHHLAGIVFDQRWEVLVQRHLQGCFSAVHERHQNAIAAFLVHLLQLFEVVAEGSRERYLLR